MPMQAESLEVLEKADVPPVQARAIVRAIEIEIVGAKDTLATKHDLLLLREELRHELRQEIGGVRREINDLRQETTAMRGELRAEMHATAGNTTRQMYMALLGQMAVLLGIAYFFVTNIAV